MSEEPARGDEDHWLPVRGSAHSRPHLLLKRVRPDRGWPGSGHGQGVTTHLHRSWRPTRPCRRRRRIPEATRARARSLDSSAQLGVPRADGRRRSGPGHRPECSVAQPISRATARGLVVETGREVAAPGSIGRRSRAPRRRSKASRASRKGSPGLASGSRATVCRHTRTGGRCRRGQKWRSPIRIGRTGRHRRRASHHDAGTARQPDHPTGRRHDGGHTEIRCHREVRLPGGVDAHVHLTPPRTGPGTHS